MFSNRYIFIYSTVMVIIVAALLSSTAMFLQPMQQRNLTIAKIQGILAAVNVDATSDNAEELFSRYISTELTIDQDSALAVSSAMMQGRVVHLGDLLKDPGDRERTLSCIPLLLSRHGSSVMLPKSDLSIKAGDRLLFCGKQYAADRMRWTLQNYHALAYVITGEAKPQGWVWRFFSRKSGRNIRNSHTAT